MSSSSALKIENLSKTYHVFDKPSDRFLQFFFRRRKKLYREFHALIDVSFEINHGETLGIIGANGAGKSTLLQIIAGTLAQTSGVVQKNGRVAALLELGAGFNPDFTGMENIRLSAKMYGLSDRDIESRLDNIVEFSGIGEFINQEVKTYSSGMYVRLAFSVMAHLDPEILIVDEALSVGDFIFQQKCATYMRETLSDVTKIIVSHDLGAIAAMADRVVVMSGGRVAFIGDTQAGLAVYQKVARAALEGLALDSCDLTKDSVSPVSGLEDEEWESVADSSRSGTANAQITAVKWSIQGGAFAKTVKHNEEVRIVFLVDVKDIIANPIIGYQVQDRFGAVIFGDNSVSSDMTLGSMEPGKYMVSMIIAWPQIAPAEYSITLGVGNGYVSDSHVVECWAHNVFTLSSVKTHPMHGIFNNKISTIDVSGV